MKPSRHIQCQTWNGDYAFLHVPIPSAIRNFSSFSWLTFQGLTETSTNSTQLQNTHLYRELQSYRPPFSAAPSPVTIKLTACMNCEPPQDIAVDDSGTMHGTCSTKYSTCKKP